MQHKVGEHSRRPAGDGAEKRPPAGRPVREATAQTRQPRPVLAALAAAGILGPVVFAVVAVVQATGMTAAGSFDGPIGIVAATIMARASGTPVSLRVAAGRTEWNPG
jgi:hypothetical protein